MQTSQSSLSSTLFRVRGVCARAVLPRLRASFSSYLPAARPRRPRRRVRCYRRSRRAHHRLRRRPRRPCRCHRVPALRLYRRHHRPRDRPSPRCCPPRRRRPVPPAAPSRLSSSGCAPIPPMIPPPGFGMVFGASFHFWRTSRASAAVVRAGGLSIRFTYIYPGASLGYGFSTVFFGGPVLAVFSVHPRAC